MPLVVISPLHLNPRAAFKSREMKDINKTKEQLCMELEALRLRVAELKKSETERKQMQERLVISERLATLGQLSGSISHELRNPLGVIDSSLYYLRTRLKGNNEKVQEHLDRIKSSVSSATTIIESLLSLTRMKEPQLGRLDLIATTSDAITTSKVPATVNVIHDFSEPEILVCGDSEQLNMVFQNIIKNAVEAMDGKGTLTVTVCRTTGEAEISFADTGPGIPKENLSRVFDPFFTTKEPCKGTGLGLSICHGIITEHGGKIYVDSDVEKGGVTFVVELPL